MSEWQPIDTAPKDGTAVLLFCPYDWANEDHKSYQAVAIWDVHCERFNFVLPGNYVQGIDDGCEPTHWMPLPELPV